MSRRFIIPAALATLAAITAGGCNDEYRHRYFSHGDKVTLGAGDAVASNIAAHTIDVWPDHVRRTKINQDGKRAAIAVKRYETNTSIRPKGLANGNSIYPQPSAAGAVAIQN
ncbi:MAG: hypothetical protein ACKVP3_16310 [Hyphomicrobiaceae bacterium]